MSLLLKQQRQHTNQKCKVWLSVPREVVHQPLFSNREEKAKEVKDRRGGRGGGWRRKEEGDERHRGIEEYLIQNYKGHNIVNFPILLNQMYIQQQLVTLNLKRHELLMLQQLHLIHNLQYTLVD